MNTLCRTSKYHVFSSITSWWLNCHTSSTWSVSSLSVLRIYNWRNWSGAWLLIEDIEGSISTISSQVHKAVTLLVAVCSDKKPFDKFVINSWRRGVYWIERGIFYFTKKRKWTSHWNIFWYLVSFLSCQKCHQTKQHFCEECKHVARLMCLVACRPSGHSNIHETFQECFPEHSKMSPS